MDPTTDQLFLLNKIKSIDVRKLTPSELTTDNKTAFPIFSNKQGKTIGAGGFFKQGKVVVIGHEAILNCAKDDSDHETASFLVNVIRWLTGKDTRVGMLVSGYSGLRSNVTSAGMTVTDVKPEQLSQKSVNVVVTDTYTTFTDNQFADIRNFVSGGGGLLCGGHNWYYKKAWVNKLLEGSGITMKNTHTNGYQICSTVPPPASNSVPHLIKDVSSISFEGITPGVLKLSQNNSFGFIDRDKNVIAAGAHCQLGRMIHFGHEAIVNVRSINDDTLQLVKNAVGWLTRLKSKISVGFLVSSDGLKKTLQDLGHTVSDVKIGDDLSPYSLLVTTTYVHYTKEELQKMQTFVANGRSLLTGGQNWSGVKAYGDILLPGGISLTDTKSGGSLWIYSNTANVQDIQKVYGSAKLDPTTDQLFLLNKIKSIEGRKEKPSEIKIDTKIAFPIFTDKQGKLLAAGGFLKNGRVVVVGHENIVNHAKDGTDHQTASFTMNVIRWLTGKATKVGMLVSGYTGLRSNATSAGMTVIDVKPDQLSQNSVDAVFTDTYTSFTDSQLDDIRSFVAGGGGLFYVGHNWEHKKKSVNNVLQYSGITFTDVQTDGYQLFIPVPPSASTSVPHLVNGVSKLSLGGFNAGILSLFDDNSFSFVDKDNNTFAAGGHYELGRMIHFGHEAIVNVRRTDDDTLRLVQNSVAWLTRLKRKTSVGFLVSANGLKTTLLHLGHTCNDIKIGDDLGQYSLLVTTTYEHYTKEEFQKIHKFVANGGSLLTGGHNWTGGKTYGEMLLPGGIFLTTSYIHCGSVSVVSKTESERNMLNIFICIKLLISHLKKEKVLSFDDQRDIAATAQSSTQKLPTTLDEFWKVAKEFLQLHKPVLISSPLDTKAYPIKASYVYISNSILENDDVDTMKKYLEAEVFPGKVPSTLKPQSKSIAINASFTGLPKYMKYSSNDVWRSTGLYAAPSVPITVTAPSKAFSKGIRVLIGCHVDDLTKKDTLKRYPRISRSFEIVSSVTKAANVFGGLIYITIPAGTDVGEIQVSIDNGYIAPEFVLGKTDDSNWKKSLSEHPVPYCELLSESMIISVQTSEVAKRVKNPTDLMKIYRDCVDVTNELSGLNPRGRARGERFVLDAQISVGYMHAGYPLMGPISASSFMLDNDAIRKDGNMWGPIHEIGHQYQTNGWTPSGGGEATNNIFSVYGSERVLNTPRERAHGAVTPAQRKRRIEEYIKNGRKYENWNVWTALETYLQLQEAFGWDVLSKIIGEYNKDMTKRPSTNQEILDEWMKRSSRITGYNLGPFYQGWGWPVSKDALNEIASLKKWDKNPMPLS